MRGLRSHAGEMFLPEHGKLGFEDILIKNGTPVCARCSKPLEFGRVMPRPVAAPKPGRKRRGTRRKN